MSIINFKSKLLLTSAITATTLMIANPANAAWPIVTTGTTTVASDASVNGQAASVTGTGAIAVTGASALTNTGNFTGLTVNVNTTGAGISSTGDFAAIDSGTSGTITGITVLDGDITSQADTNATVYLHGAAATTTIAVSNGASITNSFLSGDVINVNGNGGNQDVTIDNHGTISNTNATSSVGTNTIFVYDGNGGSTLNITNSNDGVISGGTNGNAIVAGSGGNSVTLSNQGSIIGDIVAGNGSHLFINDNSGSIQGDVGVSSGTFTLVQTGSGTVTGNVDAGTGIFSVVRLSGSSSIGGNLTLGSASQLLTFDGGSISGNIIAATNGSGDIAVNTGKTAILQGDIGTNSNRIDDVTVNGTGALNIGDHDIYVDSVTLNGAAASLNIGSGDVHANGGINGASAGQGIITVLGSTNFGTTTIGATNKVDVINVEANGFLNTGTSITANTVNIANDATVVTSSSTYAANTVLAGTGSLRLFGTYIGAINGFGDGQGNVEFADDVTTNGNIGATHSVNTIELRNLVELDASINNNTIKATNINLLGNAKLTSGAGTITGDTIRVGNGSGIASLTLGSGGFVGNLISDGSGNLVFANTQATGGNIGGTSNATRFNNITLEDTHLVQVEHNVRAYDIVVGEGGAGAGLIQTAGNVTGNIFIDANSVYWLQGGTIDSTSTVDGANPNTGKFIVDSNLTTAYDLGSTNGLEQVAIGSNRILTLGGDITALETNVGGRLNLGSTDRTINGDVVTSGSGAVIDFGTGAHMINGDFTTVAGNTIAIDISSPSLADIGNIAVSGNANIAAGTKLGISINPGLYLPNGGQYTIVDGFGGTVNAVADSDILVNGVATNKTNVLTFTTVTADANTNLQLNVARASYASVADDSNSKSVSDALNEIGASGQATGNMSILLAALDGSTNNAEYQAILDSATSQNDNSQSQGVIDTLTQSIDLIAHRLHSGDTGASSGDKASGSNGWAQAFGGKAEQDNISGTPGYDSKNAGVAFGFDKEVSDAVKVGVSLTYANTDVDSKSNTKTTDIDTYGLNLYATKEIGNAYVDGIVGAAWNKFSSDRSITAVPATASADFDGQTYLARIASGYKHKLGGGFDLVPNVTVTYAHNKIDGYTEKGAGSLNLNVDNDNTNYLEGRAGVNLGYTVVKKDFKLRPEIRTSYGYDFIGDEQSATSSFVGTTPLFATKGADVNRGTLGLGAGVDLMTSDALTLSADFNYKGNSDINSNTGSIKAKYAF